MPRGRYQERAERDFKKRVRRNRRRRRITLFVLICVTFFCIVYLLPIFAVSKNSITITGTTDKTQTAVSNYTQTLVGKNINWYSMEGISATIKQLPYIKDVDVSRHFPNRLKVVVTEATPVGQVEGSDNVFYLIDDEGKCIDSSYNSFGLGGILGLNETFAVGQIISESTKLANYTALVQELEANGLVQMVTGIDLTDDTNIQFNLGGLSIQLGDTSKLDYKFKMLMNIRQQLLSGVKGNLDLRDGSKAYFQEIYN